MVYQCSQHIPARRYINKQRTSLPSVPSVLTTKISNNGKQGKQKKIQIDQQFIFKPVKVIVLSDIFIQVIIIHHVYQVQDSKPVCKYNAIEYRDNIKYA
jgi:hypothetical protein